MHELLGTATVRGARQPESRWGAATAVLAATALHVALPAGLTAGPQWAVPALESVLLVALLLANPTRISRETRDARALSLALIAVIAVANSVALIRLVELLLHGGATTGRELVFAAAGVWLTNVVVFALVFWEVDRGGPHARSVGPDQRAEILFPQMAMREEVSWSPSFVDYLYVSFTNSTAFSPTDAMPLSRRAKMTMLVQELLSFVTVGLVLARAVNILA